MLLEGMRAKKKRPVVIADILPKSTGGFRIRERVTLYRIGDRWRKLTGRLIAENSSPSRFRRHVLYVTVAHPTWVQELTLLKFKLIDKMRGELPEINLEDIRFEIGPLPPCERSGEDDREILRRNLSADEAEFIEQAVKEIRDPDIRDSARSAMIRGFTTKVEARKMGELSDDHGIKISM